MITLSNIMADVQSDQIVAIKQNKIISFAQFRNDVCATLDALPDASAFILFEESSYRFLVGFMAALYKGSKIILPPNGLENTLSNLQGSRLEVITNQEDGYSLGRLNVSSYLLDFYTSGSTGEAKCVHKQLYQIENEINVLEQTWGTEIGAARVLATVSHQHIYGMLFKVLWSVCAGRPFVDETFEYWEQLCSDMTDDCIVVSSPAHLSRFPELRISGTPKKIFSSGGPLPLGAAKHSACVLGITPTEVFGSTETGGIAYRQQTGPNSAWQPFEAVDVQKDETGVLVIRSPYLIDDQPYETSDRIEWADEGGFHLRGRVDRIVKVEGKRVSLPEIEDRLLQSDFVSDACCLIIPDERQSLGAVIVLSDYGCLTRDKIGTFRLSRLLRGELAKFLEVATLPRRWRFVDEIPVNSQGKRLMIELLSLY